jgi:hypothetical protein
VPADGKPLALVGGEEVGQGGCGVVRVQVSWGVEDGQGQRQGGAWRCIAAQQSMYRAVAGRVLRLVDIVHKAGWHIASARWRRLARPYDDVSRGGHACLARRCWARHLARQPPRVERAVAFRG